VKPVVGVQETDRLAAEGVQAFVHCVVETAVRLGDDGKLTASISPRDRHCLVCRCAVDHDQLFLRMGLAEERRQRLANGGGGVPANRDDSDVHVWIDTLAAECSDPPRYRTSGDEHVIRPSIAARPD